MNRDYQAALNLLHAGRWADARNLYAQLLRNYDGAKVILNDVGVTHFMEGDAVRALACYDASLMIDPCFAVVHQNRGNVLMQQGLVDEAIACYYRAMEYGADKAWCINVGQQILTKLTELGRNEDIEAYWRTLLERYPDDAGILHNYANHLQSALYRYSEAIALYERLERHPQADLPQLYNDWGVALKGSGKSSKAREMYEKALSLKPFHPILYSNLLFDTLYEPDTDPEWILNLHRNYEKTQAFPDTKPCAHDRKNDAPDRPLRIGYLSSDFRYHSIAMFCLEAVKNHDPEKFEVYCYYNCPRSDSYTEQFKRYATKWKVIDEIHPTEAARMIYDDRIDILVDLNGHTRGNILPALLYKPAPIQMSWLGNVHSLGLSAVDYFITDATADPPGMTETQFVEELLRLPKSFLCFSPYENPPDILDTPALANQHITFGLVGNFAKINPFMVGLYARAMQALPGSRCLVKSSGISDPFCRERLAEMFSAEGIAPDRLILRQRTDETGEYLGTFQEIDILFDFYPFNGQTITCAALQMGTPLVNLSGKSHRSRAGLSILTALGHPEWTAETPEGFVEAAISLAKDSKKLNDIHLGLRQKFYDSPLCDGAGFTRMLEAAYRQGWTRHMMFDIPSPR